jgi:hypothetical protein
MKLFVLAVIAGTALLAGCNTTPPTPTPPPPPPPPPPFTQTASYGVSLKPLKPAFFDTKTLTAGQPASVTHQFSCLFQDVDTGADLITLTNPKPGTVVLYGRDSGGTRAELGRADFTNGLATVTFTPTTTGSLSLSADIVIDGVAYAPPTSSSDTARQTALKNKCRQLIMSDSTFATVSSNYTISSTFNPQTDSMIGLNVTVQ